MYINFYRSWEHFWYLSGGVHVPCTNDENAEDLNKIYQKAKRPNPFFIINNPNNHIFNCFRENYTTYVTIFFLFSLDLISK